MLERSFFEMLAKQAYQDGITAVSVRAVIECDGALLILKRDQSGSAPDLYEIPGGNVDNGESLDQALRREVLEETGLKVVDITDFAHSCDYFSYSSGAQKRMFVFAVTVETTEPIVMTEHTDYVWLEKKDRAAYEFVPGMQDILATWWQMPEDYMGY